jgi:hypothetical protein
VREKPISSIRLFEQGLMLPSGLDLTTEQIDCVCAAVAEFQENRSNGDAPIESAGSAAARGPRGG